MSNRTLIIFTNSFPFGKGEQYLENELPFYSKEFKRILFIPIKLDGLQRSIPSNAGVLDIHSHVKYSKTRYLTLIFKFNKFYKKEKSIRKNKIEGQKKEYFKQLFNAQVYSLAIEKWILKEKISSNDITFYSYWFYHWTTIMFFLKTSFSKSKFISRAHLYDTYDYLKFNYWGGLKINSLDYLICISNHAKSYLEKTFHFKKNNLKTLRLGVISPNKLNPATQVKNLQFVSCSSIRKDKRLPFIIDVLKEFKQEVNWIHFGDGNLMEDIKGKIKFLPSNIKVELRGFVPNSEVLSFYQNNKVDLFLNLSMREGIPVSLMEAISFGIPVVGTNVFGIPELVNEITGVLIDLDDHAKIVYEKIILFLNSNIDRKQIVDFQKKFFSAEQNYLEFKQILINNE